MTLTFIFALFKWDIITIIFQVSTDGGGDGGEPQEPELEPLPDPDRVHIPDHVDF